ncbi:MAG TPA: thiamine pyrophosphate-binding protein [Methylomirabilota bacterium]|jgi:sulfopyruvate decarboxylase subunit alpha|nr:thiamine pyrophosphate-binding protein [Methylomirabilota bacterium]
MAGPERATREGARRIVAALEAAGVTLVPSVPDTWIGWLVEELRASRRLRVVDVAREEEAIAIACGAALVGARAVVLIQNAGLLNSGAVIGSLVQLYRVPVVLLVSYRGDARDPVYYHAPKGRATEPTLAAWGVRYERAAGPERIAQQLAQAYAFIEAAREPYALLFSAEDLA